MKKIIWSLAALFMFVAIPTYAADWYIEASTGIDNPTCNTTANPCKTIAYTVSKIAGGDSIYLKGTFNEAISLTSAQNGLDSNHRTSIGKWENNDKPVINAEGNNIGLSIMANYINISNLKIENATLYGAVVAASNNVSIKKTKFSNNKNTGLFVSGSTNISVVNCFFNSNNNDSVGVGAYFFNNDNITFNNNTIYHHKTVALNISGSDAAQTSSFQNNIFYNTGATTNVGIDNNSINSGNTFNYNIYYGNNTSDVYIYDMSSYLSFSQWQSSKNKDLNSFNVDPLLVGTTAGSEDLHLQSSSPAINAGNSAISIDEDFDNETRPYNTIDIGADERPDPAAPTAIVISGQTVSSATISWIAPTTTFTSYTFEYGKAPDYSDVTSVADLTSVSTTLANLSSNTTYYYRIKSVYTTNQDTYDSAYQTGSFATLPDAPTALSATTRNVKKITLSWVAPSGSVTAYNLMYATDENFTENTGTIENITTASYEVTGFTANTAYYFKILAANDSAVSSYSDVLSARTLPAKIKNVKALKKYLTATQAKIQWKRPAHHDGLTYRVKLMTSKSKKIKTYNGITKKYKTIKILKAGTKYKVKVRAKYDADNLGNWSKTLSFTASNET